MNNAIMLERFRFANRDIDSFVVPFSLLSPDVELRLPNVSESSTAPKIGLILALEKGYEGYVIDEPYVSALLSQGATLRFLTYDNIAKQISDLELDGLLLIGGNFDSPAEYYLHPENLPPTHNLSKRSMAYLEAIAYAHKHRLPLLGICAGFQMLAGYFGAKMYLDVQQELKSTIPHKTDKYLDAHLVQIDRNSRLYRICDSQPEINVNSVHGEGVFLSEKNLYIKATAFASDGNVEAIEHQDNNWFALGVQWHPEYLYHRSDAARSLFSALIRAAMQYKTEK